MRFIFFGGGDFSVKVLEILYQNSFVPELIITTPDKPKGRGLKLQPNPVKLWTQKNDIKIYQPEKLEIRNLKFEIGEKSIDLGVIAAYGKILPEEIINFPAHGTLNVHPSLLPKFRGPSPIQSFILSGAPTQGRGEKTGVTIMLTDEQMDHGPILAMRELVSPAGGLISKLYYKELEEKLAELGGKLLVETIPKWLKAEIKPKEQDHLKAGFTKKITKEDGLIDWKEPEELIERKIRAFTPWPGAYTFIKDKRLIITEAELTDSGLKIKRVKPEGKKEMDLKDFLRGNPNPPLEKYR